MIANDFKAINAAMKASEKPAPAVNLQLMDVADCIGLACQRYGEFRQRIHIHAGNAEALKAITSEIFPMDKLIATARLRRTAIY